MERAVEPTKEIGLLARLGMDPAALDYLKAQRIEVAFFDLRPPELGFYSWHPETNPVIGLAHRLKINPVLLRCVLWEELGHHATAPELLRETPFVLSSTMERGSHDPLENVALRWASVQLISTAEIRWWLHAGGGSLDDFATTFRVTPEMARERFNALRANNPGLWRKVLILSGTTN